MVVYFRLLCSHTLCFGICNAPFNAQYDAMYPTFYGVMKIQQLRFLMGFRMGVFPLIFSPYIRGMGGPSFPFFLPF